MSNQHTCDFCGELRERLIAGLYAAVCWDCITCLHAIVGAERDRDTAAAEEAQG